MTQPINLLISLAAGFLSFLTPCVLPLIPSYIAFIGGTTLQDLKDPKFKKSQLIFRTLLFIAGFSTVFTLLGLFFWGTFRILSGISLILNIVAGSVVILLGLNIIFDFISFLLREKRISYAKHPENVLGTFLAGLAFGAGWSPCIGPILGGIIALAATGDSFSGVLNLVVYSLGLGIPFILLSLAFLPLSRFFAKIKKYRNAIRIGSGIFLIIIGGLILFGQFISFTSLFLKTGMFLEELSKTQGGAVKIVTSMIYLLLGFLPVVIWLVRSGKKKEFHFDLKLIFRFGFLFLMILLAVLESSGVLQSALLVSHWFTTLEISPY